MIKFIYHYSNSISNYKMISILQLNLEWLVHRHPIPVLGYIEGTLVLHFHKTKNENYYILFIMHAEEDDLLNVQIQKSKPI